MHTRFAEIAAAQPDSVAVSWADGQLTYRELDALADRLATGLRRADVSRETPVAVALSRGPRYVAAMLAVLKAGGMIVPLDPAMPGERVAEILRQTSAPVVIDEGVFAASVGADILEDDRAITVPVDQAAYVIFTSGTTGTPKVSSAPIGRCRPTPTTTSSACCGRRPSGSGARCESRMPGRSPSTRRGSRWSHCLTATRCTLSTTIVSGTQGRWSKRSTDSVWT